MIKQSTALLIAGLVLGIVIVATALDAFAPSTLPADPGAALSWLRRPLPDQRPERADGPPRQGRFTALTLPRASRTLAGVAALLGYGFILRYLVPHWLSRHVGALGDTRRTLLRYALTGAVALLLLGTLTFLAALSFVAMPLVPIFSFGAALAAITGLVAAAAAVGQRLRARIGDDQPAALTDLIVGLLAVMLVALVPLAGALALVGVAATGLGALVAARLSEVHEATAEAPDDFGAWQL